MVQHILRLVLSMERKKKQQKQQQHQPANSIFLTINDEKEELKQRLPALAMPNTKNTLMDELEDLKTKWEMEKSATADVRKYKYSNLKIFFGDLWVIPNQFLRLIMVRFERKIIPTSNISPKQSLLI